jgi:hypothetical protein
MPVRFSLSYNGGLADERLIDFYDVAHALVGFQRSLALTTHVLINGTVITQAPSLEGAEIVALPAEDGSWKWIVLVVGGLFAASQAPQNSLLGHLLTSAYDYVVSETLGFHIDFNKTLGQQYEELKKLRPDLKPQPQSKFDAVIDKCQYSVRDMHRPIVWSNTAKTASIASHIDGSERPLSRELDERTYEYLTYTTEETSPITFVGRVSSYNMNTYKGRIFNEEEGRPIPFELHLSARDANTVSLITRSLYVNATSRDATEGNITCTAFRNVSRSGQLKFYRIIEVRP